MPDERTEAADDFFAPPAFRPADALVQIRRRLREMRPLSERGEGYELNGKPVLELAVDGAAIRVRIAKRPALAPEWDTLSIKSSADQRRFMETLKPKLERWVEDRES